MYAIRDLGKKRQVKNDKGKNDSKFFKFQILINNINKL